MGLEGRLNEIDAAVGFKALDDLAPSLEKEQQLLGILEQQGLLEDFNALGPVDQVEALRTLGEEAFNSGFFPPNSLEDLGVR